MTLSLCGRADLIRALAQRDADTNAAMAELLGYHRVQRLEALASFRLTCHSAILQLPKASAIILSRRVVCTIRCTEVVVRRSNRQLAVLSETLPAAIRSAVAMPTGCSHSEKSSNTTPWATKAR